MKLRSILSDRHWKHWPSWDIVYEWEDEISSILDLPIKNSPFSDNLTSKVFKGIDKRVFKGGVHHCWDRLTNQKSGLSLYFEMHPRFYRNFSNATHTVPIIVDFWEKSKLEKFKRFYSDCPHLLITSFETLNYLKENGFTDRLIHFPLSLPTKYELKPNTTFEKKYDIVIAGRTNPLLWEFLKKYEVQNPEIEYLHQMNVKGELFYQSNKKGIMGSFHSREDYIKLIRSARVSFYATPGMDGGELRTNGFNPVTPRFFELLSAGCHIIARYPKNLETEFFQLEEIGSSVNSYEEFSKQMDIALNSPQPYTRNLQYLSKHYTSTRIEIIKNLK